MCHASTVAVEMRFVPDKLGERSMMTTWPRREEHHRIWRRGSSFVIEGRSSL
jgi:hypothetical protein